MGIAISYNETLHQLTLRLYIQPKASRDEIVGLHHDELKIAITAAPSDGKANEYLIYFLSKQFKVNKRKIIIHKGACSRHKSVTISGLAQLPSQLHPFLPNRIQ